MIYTHNNIYVQYMCIAEGMKFPAGAKCGMANLRTSTKILDFRGLDSSITLILRGGVLMSIGNFWKV